MASTGLLSAEKLAPNGLRQDQVMFQVISRRLHLDGRAAAREFFSQAIEHHTGAPDNPAEPVRVPLRRESSLSLHGGCPYWAFELESTATDLAAQHRGLL